MSLKCWNKTYVLKLDSLILIEKSIIDSQQNSKHVCDWDSLEFATVKLPNVLSLAPKYKEADFPAISKHEIGGVISPSAESFALYSLSEMNVVCDCMAIETVAKKMLNKSSGKTLNSRKDFICSKDKRKALRLENKD